MNHDGESKLKHAFLLLLALTLAACESSPIRPTAATPPKPELQFIDLQGFDKDLAGALGAPLPKVDVAFVDRIVPSAMPDRLQQWMASVEAGGGKVKLVPPKSTVTAKNPFMLLSAVSTLWSASKMAREMALKAQFDAARAYDAEIQLKTDDRGDTVVDRVVFIKRQP